MKIVFPKLHLIGICSIILLSGVIFTVQNYSFTKEKTIKKIPKLERALMRDLQEIEMTKDPLINFIPTERLQRARQILASRFHSGGRGPIPDIDFINFGPTNQGGRVRAIMFDPNDNTNKRVFAGAISGGLWKNEDITNNLSSWVKINDLMDNLTISCIAADPNNPMIFYAGTGEAYSGVSPGNGIYKSVDGGSTWLLLPSTVATFKYATEIIIRNEGGNSVIYAAQLDKALPEELQTGGMSTFIGTSGLFRSADGGTSWAQVMPSNVPDQPGAVDDIEIDANGNLWASVGKNGFGNMGGDVYTCASGCDQPTNWIKKFNAAENGFNTVSRTVFDIAPSNPDIIYVLGANNAGNQDIEFFVKSIDGGMNWTNIPIPNNYDLSTCMPTPNEHFTRGQATYDLCIGISPTNPDLILLGGIDMYRSTDGFMSYNHIGSWVKESAPCDKYLHADNHTILFRPGFPNEVLFANDGGVAYSPNSGNLGVPAPTFSENTKDMVTGQLYCADIGPVAGQNEFLAGLQDNGSKDWDHATGTVTPEVTGGDGGFCHIDQNQPDIQITSYTYNNYYVTTDEWTSNVSVPGSENGHFINPTDYDDINNILYGADNADKLSRVVDVGTANTFEGSVSIGGDAFGGLKATNIKVDPNTPTTIYVGSANGKVYKILNANGSNLVSTLLGSGLPDNTWVSSIDVEKGNSNHLLVTISNYGVNSVWESTNAGNTWVSIEGNLPDMPVRWGIFSPVNSNHVLLATDLGIWSTDNINGASTNWGATNTGFANVRTDMIKYRDSDKTLVIATHGRGLYKYTFPNTGLPINLFSHDIMSTKQGVLNSWVTTIELNNLGFELQRSSDGRNFEKIAWLDGQNNSSKLYQYNFIDQKPLIGRSYYRLMQVDNDKNSFYHPLKSIYYKKESVGVYIGPNPSINKLTLFNINNDLKYSLEIFTLDGKLVSKPPLDYSNSIDVSPLNNGVFVLKIHEGQNTQLFKFVKH